MPVSFHVCLLSCADALEQVVSCSRIFLSSMLASVDSSRVQATSFANRLEHGLHHVLVNIRMEHARDDLAFIRQGGDGGCGSHLHG